MDVVLLPSSTGPDTSYHFLSTYLFDGVLAVDAGSLGFWGNLADQGRVRDLVLTHTHADHIASLPVYLENVYGRAPTPTIHATQETLDCLQSDVFNDRVFPDLLSKPPSLGPFAKLKPLTPRRKRKLEQHSITAIPVEHPVPTIALLVESDDAAVLIVTDSGPTDVVWKFADKVPNLKLILLESTFSNNMRWLAELSGHLSSDQFGKEQAKGPAGIPRLAIHLKAFCRDAIVKELGELNLPGVSVMQPGKVYRV